jgi:hypothetical protein
MVFGFSFGKETPQKTPEKGLDVVELETSIRRGMTETRLLDVTPEGVAVSPFEGALEELRINREKNFLHFITLLGTQKEGLKKVTLPLLTSIAEYHKEKKTKGDTGNWNNWDRDEKGKV